MVLAPGPNIYHWRHNRNRYRGGQLALTSRSTPQPEMDPDGIPKGEVEELARPYLSRS